MTGDDLDRSYTALSEALGRVGEDRSALLLATLSLALLAREDDVQSVLDLIAQAERLAST
ncbi:hypothetical protein [Rhizobacter sp. Root404]|jgi:hypothetical protein|uniref:hypothetical protein n=1 Tax=Rhizobacter sp. Root404 TaxID=1736528 RepID=UPI0006F63414|nr:hypothetical protein [Rhizobacter sp. Root404]KQW36476.1 hypothetical protein ASC76_17540 [Rhizobacter sp. Root404]